MLRLIAISFLIKFHSSYYEQSNKFSPFPQQDKTQNPCFTIIKIDSATCYILADLTRVQNKSQNTYDGVYIIYAQKGDRTYRIVTDKIRYNYRRNIYPGQCYEFNLESYFAQDPKFPVDLELAQAQGIIINHIYLKRDVVGADDLFYDENVEGLYITKIDSKR